MQDHEIKVLASAKMRQAMSAYNKNKKNPFPKGTNMYLWGYKECLKSQKKQSFTAVLAALMLGAAIGGMVAVSVIGML